MNENKIEQVAAMNNFDKLLGRNGELAELRKEQVLDGAMHIIQQHYADKQNKMEAVAQLFGKKLGEEFLIKDYHNAKLPYVFTEKGLFYVKGGKKDLNDRFCLLKLLTGEAVIVDD